MQNKLLLILRERKFSNRSPDVYVDVKDPDTGEYDEWSGLDVEKKVNAKYLNKVKSKNSDMIWISEAGKSSCDSCGWRDGLTSSEISERLASDKKDDENKSIIPPAHYNCLCSSKKVEVRESMSFKESMEKLVSPEEGGPGSGRYPRGSGKSAKGKADAQKSDSKSWHNSPEFKKRVSKSDSKAKRSQKPINKSKKGYDSDFDSPSAMSAQGRNPDGSSNRFSMFGKKRRKESEGITTKHWFWASMESLAPKGKPEAHLANTERSAPVNPEASPQTPEEMIANNPQISASTLLNLLKSKGYEIKKKEADASSSFVAQTRESAKGDIGKFVFRTRLVEASYRDDGVGATKFRVILLKEGLGNSRDSYYYSRDAITSSVPVFEGKKIYSDHPALNDEENRPERSVRDILGYFENVGTEEQPDGCMALVGDVHIMPDKPYEWARALLRNSVDYAKKFPDKEFVGLSINANGDAQESDINEVLKSAPEGAKDKLSKALESGKNVVRVVTKIDQAVSCDLVTEAGAGGKIISLLEADMKPEVEMKDEAKDEVVETAMESIPEEKKEEAKPEHSDEEQDMELIKKMLDQHLGKDQYGEEECMSAKEAMKCAMDAGEEKDAAANLVGHAMKMAKYMASKKEAEPMEAEEEKEEKMEAAPMEAAEIIKLKGENAKLKESIASIEVEKHLDTVLRESGMRMEITKKFRDVIGTPKSKKEIDEKLKLFVEGYRNSISGETDSYEWLATATEKTNAQVTDNSVVDLSDC